VPPFPAGSTVVRRDVAGGRVWAALATRVLADGDGGGEWLALGCWPGAEAVAAAPLARWMATGAPADRTASYAARVAGRWDLVGRPWQATNAVHLMAPDRWFSVRPLTDAATGDPVCWYVNFERPFVRAAGRVDTLDLQLDLVLAPDLGRRWWKDESDLAHARRLGLVSDAEVAAVERARHEVVALADAGGPPFDQRWLPWRPDPGWPAPRLSSAASPPGPSPGS
jgi:Protein of unknown function (DUF402)